MKKQGFITITILVIFAILHSGETAEKKCYECDSRKNKNCLSELSESESVPCQGVNSCVKCEYKMLNNTMTVSRFCGQIIAPFALHNELLSKLECNTCDTDLCNNADAVSTNMVTLGGLALLWASRFVLYTDSY